MRRALGIAVALLTLVAGARADEAPSAEPRAIARAAFDEAESAAREFRFEEAQRAYEHAFDADPSAPFAPVARARAEDLAAHAEGGFAPLRALEEVRRDPKKLRDSASVEALERAAGAFPPGRVRSEARIVVAEAYWHTLGQPERAIAPLEAITSDEAAESYTRALALNELVGIARDRGDLGAAAAELDRHPALLPTLRAEIHRLIRRARISVAAHAWLIALLSVGVVSIARVARRSGARSLSRKLVRPLATGFALYVGAAAALLAKIYGNEDPRPFLFLGLGIFALDVIARAWRLTSTESRALRVVRAIACGAGVLAVGFVALERTEAGYLTSFGL
jgi:hypothetical protein